MKDGRGSIRTGIQGQGGGEVAAAGERSAGGEPQLLLSMASATYHHGDVTTAVAMIDRLDKLKALSGTKELEAAAMIYEAIGRPADAERVAQQMVTGGGAGRQG